MKLSFVIELLLIFLLIAFAASRVIDTRVGRAPKKQKQDESASNPYCSCSTDSCNCCREFALPVIPLRGPGCASLQYLQGDNMALSMKFGDRVLTSTTISGKKPKPVCMRLPGGFSKFCGRVYGISRDPEAFHACLGLEIRALDEVEAALRLSCFRFSPDGLRLEPGKPVPTDEDEDDEDEDDYGFGDDDDDDDEEEDEEEEEEEEDETEEVDEDDDDDDDLETAGVGDDNEISADYAGFSILGDLLGFGDESVESPPKKKPNKKTPTATPVAAANADKAPQPIAVVVHVSPIHNTPVVVETVTQDISNNKVMDKIQIQIAATAAPATAAIAAPTKAPTKAPHKAPSKSPPKAPPKAPTRAPTKAPTAAPTVVSTTAPTEAPAKAPTAAPTSAPTAASTSAPTEAPEIMNPTTSTEFTVNVVQDGQPLIAMDQVEEADKAELADATTVKQEEEESSGEIEDMMNDEGAKVEEMVNEVPAMEEEIKEDQKDEEEEMMEDEKVAEGEEEVDIGVVKEEEPQADEDNMATTEMATATVVKETIPEAAKVPETSDATSTVAPAVAPTEGATDERDEDDEEADSMVEEVEEAVATVIGQGEEDEEDDDEDDEDDEEDDENPDGGEKEDDDYDLGIDDDDDEEEEDGDKVQPTTTENVVASLKPAEGERRWRRRKNRLDHIFWH